MNDRSASPRGQVYRPDIDGLRAIAVLSIVAFHAGVPGIGGGYTGVDVFYVISGFVITNHLINEAGQTGGIRLLAFYARRVRRLLPALMLVVCATLFVSMLLLYPGTVRSVGWSVRSTALITANLYFHGSTGGYFDASADLMPLLHTWSLSVEEQFYLFWPPFFVLLLALGRRFRISTSRILLFAVVSIALASLFWCLWQSRADLESAFYLTPARAWEFALGGMLSLASGRSRFRPPHAAVIVYSGAAAILLADFVFDESTPFPGPYALLPTFGAAALIIGVPSASPTSLAARALTARPIVFTGLLSYSWYLWHWPLLVIARAMDLGNRVLVRDLGLAFLSLVLSYLTYRTIEVPIRYHRPGIFSRSGSTIVFGLVLSISVAAMGVLAAHWARHRDVLSSPARQSSDTAFRRRCTLATRHAVGEETLKQTETCAIGPAGAPATLVAWGDSHAGQLAALFRQLNDNPVRKTLIRSFGTCPPLIGAVPLDPLAKQMRLELNCARYNELVEEDLHRLAAKGVRGIILASHWDQYLGLPALNTVTQSPMLALGNYEDLSGLSEHSLRTKARHLDSGQAISAFDRSIRATVQFARNNRLRVLIIGPVPEMRYSIPECLFYKTRSYCDMPRGEVEARRKPTMAILNAVAADYENVRVWDPIDRFCDARTCFSERNGSALFEDDNHMTGLMSAALAEPAAPYVRWVEGNTPAVPNFRR